MTVLVIGYERKENITYINFSSCRNFHTSFYVSILGYKRNATSYVFIFAHILFLQLCVKSYQRKRQAKRNIRCACVCMQVLFEYLVSIIFTELTFLGYVFKLSNMLAIRVDVLSLLVIPITYSKHDVSLKIKKYFGIEKASQYNSNPYFNFFKVNSCEYSCVRLVWKGWRMA